MEHRSQVSVRTLWVIGLNVGAMLLLGFALLAAKTVIFIIAVALFLAMALNPILNWLERHGVGRIPGVILLMLTGLFLAVLLVLAFIPMAIQQGTNMFHAAPEWIGRLRETDAVQWADKNFNLSERIQHNMVENADTVAKVGLVIVKNIVTTVAATITAFVLTIFMLLFGEDIYRRGIALLTPERRKQFRFIAGQMQKTVGGYVIGTLLVATIGGIVITVAMLAVGLPYFLPLGFAMVILGLIPYIGPMAAAILIIGTTLATQGFGPAVIMTAVFIGYQMLENYFLQPIVQRRTIKMNPLLIVVSMLVGTSLAGLLGALLALPVAGTIQVVLQNVMNNDEPSRD